MIAWLLLAALPQTPTVDGLPLEVSEAVRATFENVVVERQGAWLAFRGTLRRPAPFVRWRLYLVDAAGTTLRSISVRTLAGAAGETRQWSIPLGENEVTGAVKLVLRQEEEASWKKPAGAKTGATKGALTPAQARQLVGVWFVADKDGALQDRANPHVFTIASVRFQRGEGHDGTFRGAFQGEAGVTGRFSLVTGRVWFNTRRQVAGQSRPVQYSLRFDPKRRPLRLWGKGSRIDLAPASESLGWTAELVKQK